MKRSWLLPVVVCGAALSLLVALGAVGERAAARAEEGALRAALASQVRLLAELARPALERGQREGGIDLEVRLRSGIVPARFRLTLIDAAGRVVADSREDPRRMENLSELPEFAAQSEGEPVFRARRDHERGVDTLYCALPIRSGERLLGRARVAATLDGVLMRRHELRRLVLCAALLLLTTTFVPWLAQGRARRRELEALVRAARELTEGGTADVPESNAVDPTNRLRQELDRVADRTRARVAEAEGERRRLSAILASMVEGVVAVDREERVVHINDVARDLLSARDRALVGEPVWKTTRVREVHEALRDALRGGVPTRREACLSSPAGVVNLELHAAPLRSPSASESAGAVLVLHDVSALRRLEAHRRDFVANVSHELKTPLTAICGLVETLLDDPEMDASTRRRFLRRAHAQAERLARLVGDVLTLSKVESEAENALERVPLDLREPLRAALRLAEEAAGAKGVALRDALPPAPVPLVGDREALREAVDNLLSNAIKFTPAGGSVVLRLSCAAEHALVEVEDTGVGIRPKDQERIFERFYRVDEARSRAMGGTGLGLSIVKHVVLAHGGLVDVRSVPGQGSVFSIRLPLADADSAGSPSPRCASA